MPDPVPNAQKPHKANLAYQTARKIVVGVVGGTVILIGLALLVLPGPAFVVIPLGFAILAIEFAWARRWLRRLKGMIRETAQQRRSPLEYVRARFARWQSIRTQKKKKSEPSHRENHRADKDCDRP